MQRDYRPPDTRCSSCERCGCSRMCDRYGERVCWCDTCWNRSCSYGRRSCRHLVNIDDDWSERRPAIDYQSRAPFNDSRSSRDVHQRCQPVAPPRMSAEGEVAAAAELGLDVETYRLLK